MSVELKVGRVYRSKRPQPAADGYVNDRSIVWIDRLGMQVQYDSPTVPNGRRLPKVDREVFDRWADRDVTDELPAGKWLFWPDFMASKSKARSSA